ncbi:right-handed parallel beta-helix repeat-containing protein [Candidatus Dojkabacteria bacterium]|nr:right-handed parallel beta-helix repeat-containing protein [Candidatus Dojkabacteria bacterium]
MKKRTVFPLLLIVIGVLGLGTAIYIVLSPESLDIREEAAGGRIIRVCSTGCDFGDINQAFAAAQDNDTIFLDTNTYDGMGVLSSSASLKLPDSVTNLTIKGKGRDSTTWKLSFDAGGNGHLLHIEKLNGVTVNIQDITFKENKHSNSSVHIYGDNANCTFNFSSVAVTGSKAAGIYYDGKNTGTVSSSYFASNEWPGVSIHGQARVTITDSTFEKHEHQGVDVKDSANADISNCEFTGNNKKYDEKDADNNTFTSGAIQFYENSKGSIKNNNLNNNLGYNIKIGRGSYGSITDSCVVEIMGNRISNAKNKSGITINGRSQVEVKHNLILNNNDSGVNISNESNVKIINNTIYANGDSGILVWDNSVTQVKNNIIVNGQEYGGICGWDFSGSIDISYNDVWNNKDVNYCTGGNSSTTVSAGTGDISKDPKFVSASDFHLQSDSPAIDTGDPDPQYNDPDGSRNDMGAYGGQDACKLDPNLSGCSCTPSCTGKQCGQDDSCGGKCTGCPSGQTCNTTSWQCEAGASNCRMADVWGPDKKPDGKINIYDFSYIQGKWKTADTKADIWGPEQKADGKVNIYDISKVSGCWKASI